MPHLNKIGLSCNILTHIKVLELLKDKLRHIKSCKSLFGQKLIWIRQSQIGDGLEDSANRSLGEHFYKEDA